MTSVRAADPAERLAALLARRQRIVVLSGAGISTGSGIPDYRDADGAWKRPQPISFQRFREDREARRRYWARTHAGWPTIAGAEPAPAHYLLARAEAAGRVSGLITQNVDGLHSAAGHRAVIDLHGRVDRIRCLGCDRHWPRQQLEDWLEARFGRPSARAAPDGDAELTAIPPGFRVPDCPHCPGLLKPDVVFFGENVPRERLEGAMAMLDEAGLLLVVGSSLMVWSGYRFVLAARERGLPCAAINLGRTRADALLDCRLAHDCDNALAALLTTSLAESPAYP